eukprot:7116617-Prorocentrum_lima.AAC.1
MDAIIIQCSVTFHLRLGLLGAALFIQRPELPLGLGHKQAVSGGCLSHCVHAWMGAGHEWPLGQCHVSPD